MQDEQRAIRAARRRRRRRNRVPEERLVQKANTVLMLRQLAGIEGGPENAPAPPEGFLVQNANQVLMLLPPPVLNGNFFRTQSGIYR